MPSKFNRGWWWWLVVMVGMVFPGLRAVGAETPSGVEVPEASGEAVVSLITVDGPRRLRTVAVTDGAITLDLAAGQRVVSTR